MAAGRQAFFSGTGMKLWGQQYVDHVGPCFAKHGRQASEGCRNSIALLDSLRPLEAEVADGYGFSQFGNRLQRWSVTFRYVSCAQESDAESP
jgi:hypothetical protein